MIKYKEDRKDNNFRCGDNNSFLVKDIYEEIVKRIVNPIYIIILSLISSLLILKPKSVFLQNNIKFILFFIGFVIILCSQLSYKFINYSIVIEFLFLFYRNIYFRILYFYFI